MSSSLKNKILYCFFPRRCALCGEVVELDSRLCEKCKCAPRILGEKCDKCGKEKSKCSCKYSSKTPQYKKITAPFYFDGNVITAVHRLKFQHYSELVDEMAREMAVCVKEDFRNINFDAVTYVPMTKKRAKARGYNQSELLAERLSELLNIELEHTFYKEFERGPQRGKSAKKRAADIFGAFDINEGISPKGKTYLVVDDVKTTGSTLNECAAVLDCYGACEVFAVTLSIR